MGGGRGLLQSLNFLPQTVGLVGAFLHELPLAGLELPAALLEGRLFLLEFDLLAADFVALPPELGIEVGPFVLKLLGGLLEALPLAGLVEFDIVAEPIEFALLAGAFRLEFLGDAAALGFGLLALEFELILLAAEPLFEFRAAFLAARELLDLGRPLLLGQRRIVFGVAELRFGGLDRGLALLQIFLLLAELLGRLALLLGPAALVFRQFELGAVQNFGLAVILFGLLSQFFAGELGRRARFRGNGLAEQVELRGDIGFDTIQPRFLRSQQLFGPPPLTIERAAAVGPTTLRRVGLRF